MLNKLWFSILIVNVVEASLIGNFANLRFGIGTIRISETLLLIWFQTLAMLVLYLFLLLYF